MVKFETVYGLFSGVMWFVAVKSVAKVQKKGVELTYSKMRYSIKKIKSSDGEGCYQLVMPFSVHKVEVSNVEEALVFALDYALGRLPKSYEELRDFCKEYKYQQLVDDMFYEAILAEARNLLVRIVIEGVLLSWNTYHAEILEPPAC